MLLMQCRGENDAFVVADSVLFNTTGYQVDAFSVELADQIKRGDLSLLFVAHAMSCGLKVLTSEMACDGIEVCRRVRTSH